MATPKKIRDAEAFTHLCERDERGRMWPAVKMSSLERKFLDVWAWLDGPDLERETMFDAEHSATLKQAGGRKWRADFVHRGTKTMIEIEGGAWTGGRHTRGTGFTEDATKYLRAWELGWSVLRLSEAQITERDVRRIIAKLRGRVPEISPDGPISHGLPVLARPEWVVSMGTAG